MASLNPDTPVSCLDDLRSEAKSNPRINGCPQICILTEGFYPPAVGGLQKNLHDLAASFAVKGMKVTVVTRQSMPPSPVQEFLDGFRIVRIPPAGQLKGKGWRAIIPLSLFLIRVFRVLIRQRGSYDVLLVSGVKILPVAAVTVGRWLNKACVIRPESPIEFDEVVCHQSRQQMRLRNHSVLIKLIQWGRYRLAQAADCVLAISPEIQRTLLASGFEARRVEPMPNGIDFAKFYPASTALKFTLRDQLRLPREGKIFVFTGRLTTSKGIPELIRVWQKISPQYPDACLLLVGSGQGSFDDCEPQLQAMIERGTWRHCIKCAGAVANVQDYLRASDVFVFPSHYEGFGLSIIEAMACALPVIVTTVGVAPQIIQNKLSGWLIKPRNEAALESAIEWMLAHQSHWKRMGDAAQSVVEGKYNCETVAEQHLNLFERVLENRRQRRAGQKIHGSQNLYA